jgi:DNA-binding helix-hairpin-helix protein with protein kinase domain
VNARQLERRAATLRHLVARIRELREQFDGLAIRDAEENLREELRMVEQELKEKRCPQRARKTRNGSKAEWAAVRRSVRGVAEGQLLVTGETVGDVVAADLRAKGIRA